ncbi:MAG TPA: hypothetical protein VGI00_07510 [Streptosporangiaceae bacterium]
MDEEVKRYVAGIAGEHRELFGRVNGLILGAYPEAVVKLSYRMPSYWVGKRRLYIGVWQHGLSIYGWPQGREAAFIARHPALKTSKGTIQIRPRDAAGLSDGELLELVHAGLGGGDDDR